MSFARRQQLVALISGVVFALGLGIAGMTNPYKVLNFLDMFGDWDPSLALVMGGAILAYAPIYHAIKHRDAPKFGDRFHWPTAKDVDLKLVVGAVAFGLGWGLSGFCPGPALVAVTAGTLPVLTFFAALIAGMILARLFMRMKDRRSDRPA